MDLKVLFLLVVVALAQEDEEWDGSGEEPPCEDDAGCTQFTFDDCDRFVGGVSVAVGCPVLCGECGGQLPVVLVFDLDYSTLDVGVFEESILQALETDFGIGRADVIGIAIKPGSVIAEITLRTPSQRDAISSGIVVTFDNRQVSGDPSVPTSDTGLSTGAIAGIAVGSAVFLGGFVFFITRTIKRKALAKKDIEWK